MKFSTTLRDRMMTAIASVTIVIIFVIAIQLYLKKDRIFSGNVTTASYNLSLMKNLPGVNNLSSLTYDHDNKTLFATINSPPSLLKLNMYGEILGVALLDFMKDAESVEYIGDGRYALADERDSMLYIISITDDMKTQMLKEISVDLFHDRKKNRGYEGLAWDTENNRLYLGREKGEERLYSLSFDATGLAISGINLHPDQGVKDISGLSIDGSTLLILSDESKVLLFIQAGTDTTRSVMTLKKGYHGLDHNIPQPEGVTTDAEGNLYIVSEPDIFYKFVPTDH